MIDVLTVDHKDGWAYVRKDMRTMLIRPPYRIALAATARDVMIAVTRNSYTACEKTVNTWDDVKAFVRGEVAAHRGK